MTLFWKEQKIYGKTVSKEDIFYYVYGFLHNSEYRKMFTNDLKRMLPRFPFVEEVKDFWKFCKAGREWQSYTSIMKLFLLMRA